MTGAAALLLVAMAAPPEPEEFELDEVESVVAAEPEDEGAQPGGEDGSAEPEPVEPEPVESEAAPSNPVEPVPAAPEPAPPEPAAPESAAATSEPAEPEPKTAKHEAAAPTSARDRWHAFTRHVHPSGFVQVDFLHRQISEDELSDGTREPLNETGFVLRNARIGADADWKWVGATAYAEVFSNGGSVRPATFDVHAQVPARGDRAPWVQLRAGLLRVPFGFENYGQNDVQRFFGERSLVVHALMPGLFDVGASLQGSLWALRWIVGIYNGQPVGAPGFGYRDPNRAKDVAGRLQLRGDVFRRLNAAVGFSFLTGRGFSAGTPPTKDAFEWTDLNEDGRVTVAELIPISGSAGRASENFKRWGLGADVQLRADLPKVGELMLYAELAAGENLDRAVAIADPVLLGRDQRGLGWYVAFSQALTRHASVGVRYDEYYPDLDGLEPFDGTVVITRQRFRTLAGGVAGHVYYGKRVRGRLLVEYEHQVDNDLGRDARGRPDKLDNDTLRVRAEVRF